MKLCSGDSLVGMSESAKIAEQEILVSAQKEPRTQTQN